MIAQRRSRVINRILTLACGKTVGIATGSSAVVVPTRSPVIVVIGRSATVATIVATTWRGGSKGESSRQVDGVASVRVLPSVGKQANVAADMSGYLLESAGIGLGTSPATRGIADVDHAWCRCGNRGGWCGHVLGSHTCSRSVGNNVVGRDGSWGDLGIGIAVEDERGRVLVADTAVDEDVAVVVGCLRIPNERTKAEAGRSSGRWWRRRRPVSRRGRWLRDVVIVAVVEAVVDEGARISFGVNC